MLDGAARVVGLLLGAVFAAVGRLRPPARPLHPRGRVTGGKLVRHGDGASGVGWLDSPGADRVTVRFSKSAGTPGRLPDIQGLALRVPMEGNAVADLLFSTTGVRPVARHVLVPATSARRPMTTLLPYRSPGGPLLLGAFPDGDGALTLRWARLRGPWRPFATLVPDDELPPGEYAGLRFDAVCNPLPGLPNYSWVARLRAPAYRAARRSSNATAADVGRM